MESLIRWTVLGQNLIHACPVAVDNGNFTKEMWDK